MAIFKILTTFNITNRGFVLCGDITDDGTISPGDWAIIPNGSISVEVRIFGVEMVDKIGTGIAHIGLLVSVRDQEKIKDLVSEGTEITTRKK